MKKLSIALAIAGAFAASGANAAMTLGQYDTGCLVPVAMHSASTNTVVGLTSTTAATVYWTFFGVNSNHITDGQFTMTANDQTAFSWAANAGAGLAGVAGYLVFTADTAVAPAVPDGILNAAGTAADLAIACNAFQVTANDAAFVPAPNLDITNYVAGINLTTMNNASIIGLAGGTAPAATNTHMRYWIDGAANGRDTSVLVWTSDDAGGTYTVNIYDDAQNRKSVNFALPNAELNIINPETIVGRPANFLDGFIDWSLVTAGSGTTTNLNLLPRAAADNGLLTFSIVTDPAFGATQTLSAPTYP